MGAPRRILMGLLIGGIAIGGLGVIAAWPVTMTEGVNYRVQVRRVPLAVKAMTFLLRDYEYRRLTREITQGLTTDGARAAALCAWTKAHIRPTPRGWPVTDDHILNVIIRGYGDDDQAADVFATLVTYAGLPAFWKIVRPRAGDEVMVFAFVKIDRRWTLWDVRRGVVFNNTQGTPASVEELTANPALVERTIGTVRQGDQAYRLYVEDALASVVVPGTPRAYKQMPLRRLFFELGRLWHRMAIAG